MIRVNDRMDSMMGVFDLPGAELADPVGRKRTFVVPQGEFTARLTTAGAVTDRFAVAIGDPDDTVEGVAPNMWFGIVESWQPAGSNIRVVCRPARNVQETSGTLLPASGSGQPAPRLGGVG